MTSSLEFDVAASKIAHYIKRYVKKADALVADSQGSALAARVSTLCNLPVFGLVDAGRFDNPVQVVSTVSKSTRFVAPTITCANITQNAAKAEYPYAYCAANDNKSLT